MAAVKEQKTGPPPSKKELVAECLRELIISGMFKKGDALPDLEGMAERSVELFGVSISSATIRGGEGILEAEKTITKIKQGVSTRVAKIPAKLYAEVYSPQYVPVGSDVTEDDVQVVTAKPAAAEVVEVIEPKPKEEPGNVISGIPAPSSDNQYITKDMVDQLVTAQGQSPAVTLEEPVRVRVEIVGNGNTAELVNEALVSLLTIMADSLQAAASQIKAGQPD